MRLCKSGWLVLLASVAASLALVPCVTQGIEPTNNPADSPRLVLAFYYPWYGNPQVPGGSGRPFHWERIDEANRQIGSSTNYPSLGPYDSHDTKLIAQHCRWAKESNVDGFVISWWGKGTFEDQAMPRILDGCQAAALKATIYYETTPQPKNASTAATDIVALLENYGEHPAWLRVQGKPVLFIYARAIDEIGLDGWKSIVAQVNERYKQGVVILGDRLDAAAARIFDGMHTYITAGALERKALDQVRQWAKANYAAWVNMAQTNGRISTATVIPGYDDTKIRKPGIRVDRMNGDLYRAQWQEAIAANPQWVLITSWNEWHEGTEIEPSVELGEKYLTLTRELAGQFKAAK